MHYYDGDNIPSYQRDSLTIKKLYEELGRLPLMGFSKQERSKREDAILKSIAKIKNHYDNYPCNIEYDI
jgi:hypothetical protein